MALFLSSALQISFLVGMLYLRLELLVFNTKIGRDTKQNHERRKEVNHNLVTLNWDIGIATLTKEKEDEESCDDGLG